MADLITRDYAKQALQADASFSAAEDAIIDALVTACSEAIRSYCKREFDSQSFTERYDGVDDTRLVLRQYPVVSVESLGVDGTAHEKPAFRSAFKKRRCLLVQDGFYEWKADGSKKLPHHFTLSDGGPFAVAALWERWDGEVPLETVALLTTEANDLVRPCHDRMPVILSPDAQRTWLDDADVESLRALLVPYPAERMTARAVSKAVGSVRNEGPQCLEAAGPAQMSLF